MADIAFLLLIFFLVATTLLDNKGLSMQLPADVPPTETPIKERNLFKIQINSKNQFLIENEIRNNLDGVTEELTEFIMNPQQKGDLAERPEKAIISIKTQRGTEYKYFIETLDAVKESYYRIYGNKIGLSSDEFRALNLNDKTQLSLYETARAGVPMNISIADN